MAEEFDCFDFLPENDCFFDLLPEDDCFFHFDPTVVNEFPFVENFIQSSPDSWIGEIENQLMNDDNNHEIQNSLELDQEFSEFLDVFADYPTSDSGPGPVDLATCKVSDVVTIPEKEVESSDDSGKEKKVDASKVSDVVIISEKDLEGSDDSGKEKKADASNDSGNESRDGSKVESEIEGNDDAVAKKRTRRLRNKDAAVRSRERKKEFVKDLETKSKFLERECMRLGRILDCYVAENHALRLSLHKGSGDTSKTRQESAVLLLESLLLGSLLWFLVIIICQFPYMPLLNTKCCLLLPELRKLVRRERGGSSIKPSNTAKCRRCKGSRPRMKPPNVNSFGLRPFTLLIL